ncbi:hypothetical protein V2G26_020092 [Clonostachys chloroleuca]
MCTGQPVLYHHIAPCTRAPSYSISYAYCPYAVRDPATLRIVATCPNVIHIPSSAPLGTAPWPPGCLIVSPECSSGLCRLEDLDGAWVCCRCQRSGNTHVYCLQPKRGSPDTFCYHRVCQGCTRAFMS